MRWEEDVAQTERTNTDHTGVGIHGRTIKFANSATVCLPWQHWTNTLVWFDDFDISAFHICVVDLWQSLSEWHLLLSACVVVCRRENVGA